MKIKEFLTTTIIFWRLTYSKDLLQSVIKFHSLFKNYLINSNKVLKSLVENGAPAALQKFIIFLNYLFAFIYLFF